MRKEHWSRRWHLLKTVHIMKMQILQSVQPTYAWHLTQAHAFIDGNKRIAAAVSEIFAEINGLKLNATDDQIVDLFLGIASGEKSRNDVEQIFLQWLS